MKVFSRKVPPVVAVKTCSACGESLAEHTQLDIASAPLGSDEDRCVATLIAERRWSDASEHRAANAVVDIRVWRMIRCGDGRVGVVVVVLPIDIWSDDYYEEPEFLTGDERDQLLAELA